MAEKTIGQLPLRDGFSEGCNIPVEDLIQSWRVSGKQILDFIMSKVSPVGSIIGYPVAGVPEYFVALDGSTYLIDEHEELFNLIGHNFKNCRNMSTGENYPDPPTGMFRTLDARGCYLRHFGQAFGYPNIDIGQFMHDKTAPNGLSGNQIPTPGHDHNIGHVHAVLHQDIEGNMYGKSQVDANTSIPLFVDTPLYQRANQPNVNTPTAPKYLADAGVGANKTYFSGGVVGNLNSGIGGNARSGAPSSTYTLVSSDAETAPVSVGINWIMRG